MIDSIKKYSIIAVLLMVIPVLIFPGQEPLQTQETDLWEGIEVDLTKISVKNNVVTIKMKLKNTGDKEQSIRFNYRDSYIMDETNQKKYYLLKDSDGMFICGPLFDKDGGGRFWYSIKPGKSKNFWLKFPEPTDSPETISISLPGMPPFDEVELKK